MEDTIRRSDLPSGDDPEVTRKRSTLPAPPAEATLPAPPGDTTRNRGPAPGETTRNRGPAPAEATRNRGPAFEPPSVPPLAPGADPAIQRGSAAAPETIRRAVIAADPDAWEATRARGELDPVPPKRSAGFRPAGLLRGLANGLAGIGRAVGKATIPLRELLAPVTGRIKAAAAVVSGLGWMLLGCSLASWAISALAGWSEFSYLAAFGLILFAICILFSVGRLRLQVELEVEPRRVVVGDAAAAQLSITNLAARPVLPFGVEVPVGAAVARYTTPAMPPKSEHSEIAVIPTGRRGVIDVGPVTSQRGDPFGVLRREITWTESIEMFIHPVTVPLEPLGAGMLRDLEGRTTNDISMSDLAFHTLREYEPGDDRRYIHWRSSAKMTAVSGAGKFMVRQFLDTRRSHIAVIVDVDENSYSDPEDFELAISAAASVVMRALIDEMDLTIVCGRFAVTQPPPSAALDTFSRAEFEPVSLAETVSRLSQIAPDVSVAMMVTGATAEFSGLVKAKAYLPPEVNAMSLIAQCGAEVSLREIAATPVITIGSLQDLPRLVVAEMV